MPLADDCYAWYMIDMVHVDSKLLVQFIRTASVLLRIVPAVGNCAEACRIAQSIIPHMRQRFRSTQAFAESPLTEGKSEDLMLAFQSESMLPGGLESIYFFR
jgi:hypothetical protein